MAYLSTHGAGNMYLALYFVLDEVIPVLAVDTVDSASQHEHRYR